MGTMLAHAVLPHRHIGGQELADGAINGARIDAEQIGKAVAHLVHDMMGHMTMHGPVAGIVSHKFDRARGTGRHQNRGVGVLGRLGNFAAIGLGDAEGIAVQMDGVVVHAREIAEADAHTFAALGEQRLGARIDPCIHGQQVKIRHLVGIGAARARLQLPGREQDGVVTVRKRASWTARMHDNHAHQAHGHLGHLVMVGVVHEGAVLAEGPLIDKGLARLDRGL